MDNKSLVKEVITTETEKYGENGKIKEKVRETREKIYSTAYTQEEMAAAPEKKSEVVEETPPPQTAPVEEKSNNEKMVEEAVKMAQQQAGYNVVNRTTPMPMSAPSPVISQHTSSVSQAMMGQVQQNSGVLPWEQK